MGALLAANLAAQYPDNGSGKRRERNPHAGPAQCRRSAAISNLSRHVGVWAVRWALRICGRRIAGFRR